MIYYTWRPDLRDEADNHLIELGVAGKAEYLVTRNIKEFQGSRLHFPQLRILSSGAFINEVSVMGSLTIRLTDDKHERLRQIAK